LYKEAINNAAKYSKCNNLQIEVKQDQHSVRLIITDDGIGFNGQEIKAGNGLANMRERAAAMAADFTIHSSEGSGTKILLTIPLT
jgi:signal transduction histidine kinase